MSILAICQHVLHLISPHSVQEGILGDNHAFQVVAQNYPLFLWRDGEFHDDDPYSGFLQNMLLVKVRGFPPTWATLTTAWHRPSDSLPLAPLLMGDMLP